MCVGAVRQKSGQTARDCRGRGSALKKKLNDLYLTTELFKMQPASVRQPQAGYDFTVAHVQSQVERGGGCIPNKDCASCDRWLTPHTTKGPHLYCLVLGSCGPAPAETLCWICMRLSPGQRAAIVFRWTGWLSAAFPGRATKPLQASTCD